MITHLPHEAIDKPAWDRRLEACSGPTWYARSAVLDVASPGWEALVDHEGGCMPLTWGRRLGVDYLYQPFLLQQLGVFAPSPSAERTGRFLQGVPDRFRYWDIRLNDTQVEGAPADVRFSMHTDLCLPLDRDPDELRAAYSTNHQRNLRKALRTGLVVEKGLAAREFVDFISGSPQAADWDLSSKQWRVFQALLASGSGGAGDSLLGVRGEAGTLLAAAWFTEHADRVYFLKGIASEAGREARAMFLLLDHAIGAWAGRAALLDLAGSDRPALARFYAGFGAERHVYLRAMVNRLPRWARWLKP